MISPVCQGQSTVFSAKTDFFSFLMYPPPVPAPHRIPNMILSKKAVFFFFLIGKQIFSFWNQGNCRIGGKALDKVRKFEYDNIVNGTQRDFTSCVSGNDCDKESRLEEQTAAGRTAYAPETGGYLPTDADAEFSKRFEDDTWNKGVSMMKPVQTDWSLYRKRWTMKMLFIFRR